MIMFLNSAQKWLQKKNISPFQKGIIEEMDKPEDPIYKPFLYGWGRKMVNYGQNKYAKQKIETYWVPPGKDKMPNWNYKKLRTTKEIEKYRKLLIYRYKLSFNKLTKQRSNKTNLFQW